MSRLPTHHHVSHHVHRMLRVKIARVLRQYPVLQSEMLLLLAVLISLVCGTAAVALPRAIGMVSYVMHTGGIGVMDS
jgi:hypothetical protein